jgi:Kdo2-lipid IVA lauroyltransferase/acyltransferase
LSDPAVVESTPSFRHKLELNSMRALGAVLGKLSWSTACRVGERIGELGYSPAGIRRDVVERQIAAAFPNRNEGEVKRIARASYRHLGRNAIEAILGSRKTAQEILGLVEQVDGWEHIEKATSGGRGAIGVAAHHGNWELLGGFLAARGLIPEVVVRGMENRLFEEYLNENRERLGLRVVNDKVAVRQIARSLRDGRFVCMLSDQGVLGLASSFVPFFGRPAKTARGFAVFALRFEVPVCFMDMVRLPNGRFRAVFEPIEIERTGDRERDIDAMVARYSEVLEKWVREYPEQYFWQHRRWRRQPEGTPVELRDPALDDPSSWTPSR